MLRVAMSAALVVCAAGQAGAEPCATASGESLAEGEAQKRLGALSAALDRNRGHMRAWSITWFSLYTAAAAVQGGLAVGLDDADDKRVYGVGGVRAAIAAAAVPILRIKTRSFEATGDTCADLSRAEAVMRENIALHAKGRGWLKHAGVVGLNLATFLILGVGFDLWERGAIGLGIGLAVGEIQIFTQPMGSRDIARDYERGRPSSAVAITPLATPEGFGLALGGSF